MAKSVRMCHALFMHTATAAMMMNDISLLVRTSAFIILMSFPLQLYRWFSRGVASLLEGKSRGLCLVQLCARYRQVSTTMSLTISGKR